MTPDKVTTVGVIHSECSSQFLALTHSQLRIKHVINVSLLDLVVVVVVVRVVVVGVVVVVVVGVVVVVIVVVGVVHIGMSHSYMCNLGCGTSLHLCLGTFSPVFLIKQSYISCCVPEKSKCLST